MRQVGKLFAHNIFWAAVASLNQAISTFLLTAIITRRGGSTSYGTWSLLIAISTIIGALTTLRLSTAMIRDLAGTTDPRRQEQRFFLVLTVTILFSLSATAASLRWDTALLSIFGEAADMQAVRLGLFFIVAYSVELVLLDSFRTFDRMRGYAFTVVARTWSIVMVIWILYEYSLPFSAIILAVLIARLTIILFTGTNIVYVQQLSIRRWIRGIDGGFIPEYFTFALPFLIDGLFTMLLHSGDRFVLGYFTDVATVGIYSAGYNVGALITLLIGPMQLSIYHVISGLWNRGKFEDAMKYVSLAMKTYVFLALPLAVIVSSNAPLLLRIVTSSSDGYQVVPFVAGGLFFFGIHSISLLVITLSRRTWRIAIIGITFSTLNLLLNLLFIGYLEMSLVGAAMATLIAFFLMAIASASLAFGQMGISRWPRFFVKVLVASMLMAAFLYFFSSQSLLVRSLQVIASGLIYLTILGLTNVRKVADLSNEYQFLLRSTISKLQVFA